MLKMMVLLMVMILLPVLQLLQSLVFGPSSHHASRHCAVIEVVLNRAQPQLCLLADALNSDVNCNHDGVVVSNNIIMS